MLDTQYPMTVTVTNTVCLVLLAGVGAAIWYQADNTRERALNLLLAMLGGLIGWLVGIFLTPYPGEETQFAAIGAAVSAFLSGYLVSKLDRFFEATLYSQQVNPVAWVRVVLFGVSVLLVLVCVTTNRQYLVVRAHAQENEQKAPSKPGDPPGHSPAAPRLGVPEKGDD